jgi:hypothetical protein
MMRLAVNILSPLGALGNRAITRAVAIRHNNEMCRIIVRFANGFFVLSRLIAR